MAIFAIIVAFILYRYQKHGYIQYVLYLQWAVQSVLIILQKITEHQSTLFDAWEIPFQFAIIMFLPVHQFHQPLIIAAPFLIAVCYIVTYAQYDALKSYKEHLPHDFSEKYSKDDFIGARLAIIILFLGIVCACQYMI